MDKLSNNSGCRTSSRARSKPKEFWRSDKGILEQSVKYLDFSEPEPRRRTGTGLTRTTASGPKSESSPSQPAEPRFCLGSRAKVPSRKQQPDLKPRLVQQGAHQTAYSDLKPLNDDKRSVKKRHSRHAEQQQPEAHPAPARPRQAPKPQESFLPAKLQKPVAPAQHSIRKAAPGFGGEQPATVLPRPSTRRLLDVSGALACVGAIAPIPDAPRLPKASAAAGAATKGAKEDRPQANAKLSVEAAGEAGSANAQRTGKRKRPDPVLCCDIKVLDIAAAVVRLSGDVQDVGAGRRLRTCPYRNIQTQASAEGEQEAVNNIIATKKTTRRKQATDRSRSGCKSDGHSKDAIASAKVGNQAPSKALHETAFHVKAADLPRQKSPIASQTRGALTARLQEPPPADVRGAVAGSGPAAGMWPEVSPDSDKEEACRHIKRRRRSHSHPSRAAPPGAATQQEQRMNHQGVATEVTCGLRVATADVATADVGKVSIMAPACEAAAAVEAKEAAQQKCRGHSKGDSDAGVVAACHKMRKLVRMKKVSASAQLAATVAQQRAVATGGAKAAQGIGSAVPPEARKAVEETGDAACGLRMSAQDVEPSLNPLTASKRSGKEDGHPPQSPTAAEDTPAQLGPLVQSEGQQVDTLAPHRQQLLQSTNLPEGSTLQGPESLRNVHTKRQQTVAKSNPTAAVAGVESEPSRPKDLQQCHRVASIMEGEVSRDESGDAMECELHNTRWCSNNTLTREAAEETEDAALEADEAAEEAAEEVPGGGVAPAPISPRDDLQPGLYWHQHGLSAAPSAGMVHGGCRLPADRHCGISPTISVGQFNGLNLRPEGARGGLQSHVLAEQSHHTRSATLGVCGTASHSVSGFWSAVRQKEVAEKVVRQQQAVAAGGMDGWGGGAPQALKVGVGQGAAPKPMLHSRALAPPPPRFDAAQCTSQLVGSHGTAAQAVHKFGGAASQRGGSCPSTCSEFYIQRHPKLHGFSCPQSAALSCEGLVASDGTFIAAMDSHKRDPPLATAAVWGQGRGTSGGASASFLRSQQSFRHGPSILHQDLEQHPQEQLSSMFEPPTTCHDRNQLAEPPTGFTRVHETLPFRSAELDAGEEAAEGRGNAFGSQSRSSVFGALPEPNPPSRRELFGFGVAPSPAGGSARACFSTVTPACSSGANLHRLGVQESLWQWPHSKGGLKESPSAHDWGWQKHRQQGVVFGSKWQAADQGEHDGFEGGCQPVEGTGHWSAVKTSRENMFQFGRADQPALSQPAPGPPAAMPPECRSVPRTAASRSLQPDLNTVDDVASHEEDAEQPWEPVCRPFLPAQPPSQVLPRNMQNDIAHKQDEPDGPLEFLYGSNVRSVPAFGQQQDICQPLQAQSLAGLQAIEPWWRPTAHMDWRCERDITVNQEESEWHKPQRKASLGQQQRDDKAPGVAKEDFGPWPPTNMGPTCSANMQQRQQLRERSQGEMPAPTLPLPTHSASMQQTQQHPIRQPQFVAPALRSNRLRPHPREPPPSQVSCKGQHQRTDGRTMMFSGPGLEPGMAAPTAAASAPAISGATSASEIIRRALSRAEEAKKGSRAWPVEVDDDDDEDGWPPQLVQDLQLAYYSVEPTHPNFWCEVAKHVHGKTPAECFSRVYASVRERDERAIFAKACQRYKAPVSKGVAPGRSLTLAAARKWSQKAHAREQLERLAPLGGLQDGTDREGSKVEEGDEADGPPVRANSRRRRVQLSLPDNPAEIRDVLDDLKQKNHADRFITSFLHKQGGWTKWHKAVKEASERRQHGAKAAGAPPKGVNPNCSEETSSKTGRSHDDTLARLISKMLAKEKVLKQRQEWRDDDRAEGREDDDSLCSQDSTGDLEDGGKEDRELLQFLVEEGLVGPDGLPAL